MDDFWETYNSYPLAQKIIVFVLGLVVIFLVFWMFPYSSLQTRLSDLRDQKTKLRQDKDKYKEIKAKRERYEKRVEELKQAVVAARTKLPAKSEIDELVRALNEKAQTAGLEIRDMNRQGEEKKSNYVEIPIKMKFEGTFGELVNFLEFVKQMERIVSFRNLSLERKDGSDRSSELVVETLATTYRYRAE